jgi:hypothetical protein
MVSMVDGEVAGLGGWVEEVGLGISRKAGIAILASLQLAALVLTGRISRLSQRRQLCAFRDGADCGEQADHEDAAEGPSVIDRDFDFREVVQRAEAVEEVGKDVAGCDWKSVSSLKGQKGKDRTTYSSAYKNSPH